MKSIYFKSKFYGLLILLTAFSSLAQEDTVLIGFLFILFPSAQLAYMPEMEIRV